MSVRSVLRDEALERDGYRCQWPPDCQLPGRLEMAHIVPLGSGGKDVIEGVVMLCRFHHDMHDGRQQRSLWEYRQLMLAYVALKNGYEQ